MSPKYEQIPGLTMESLERYVAIGRPTGGFLQAVLEHDLFAACGRADSDNLAALADIVKWVYNEAPAGCHGTPEKVSQWIFAGGMQQFSLSESEKDQLKLELLKRDLKRERWEAARLRRFAEETERQIESVKARIKEREDGRTEEAGH